MSFEPVDIRLTLYMPASLKRLLMSLALVYHRLRYGYSARLIPVGRGRYAIVDADDYDRLAKYKWQLCSNGHTSYAFRYSSRSGGKKRHKVLMHREVIDIPEGMVCDHINRKAHDNRKANLRPATVSQNSCNTRNRSQATSRYRGVSQVATSNKWVANIRANGRRIYLGVFDDKVDAAKAYDVAAKKYHGEFAVLNFPDRTPSRLRVWIEQFFAKIAARIKPSLQSRPKSNPTLLRAKSNDATSPRAKSSNPTSPRAKSRGLLKQISPLQAALRPFGRNDNVACGIFSSKHTFSICRYFQKVYQNSVKVTETCARLIKIVPGCTIMNTVQMPRGP